MSLYRLPKQRQFVARVVPAWLTVEDVQQPGSSPREKKNECLGIDIFETVAVPPDNYILE